MNDLSSLQQLDTLDERVDRGPRSGAAEEPASSIECNATVGRRILIVDDDESLAGFLSEELRSQGFFIELLADGASAVALLAQKHRFDLLILDLNLPKLDGIDVIRQIRPSQPKLPVLVLTARSRVEERVQALETGADDCLTKPFSLSELQARVNALLRRNSGLIPNCSIVGDLALYRDEHRVERNGRRIDLTPREFSILEVLMRNPGRPVSRASLLEEVWNMSPESATNIVDVYVKYVRDKIDLPGEARLTHTVRGFGYELRAV